MTPPRRLLLAAVVAVLTLVVPAPAGAAVPREFFGVMVDGVALRDSVDLGSETKLMARSGVGSVRMAFYWRGMQPEQDGPIDFSDSDRVVGAAVGSGLRVLPTLVRAPSWATGGDDSEGAVPDSAAYASFAAEFLRRYGKTGSFWRLPGMRFLPMTSVQVWNEPDIGRYWDGKPWPSTYVKLLRATRPALKAVDPSVQVVTAGLTNKSWLDLKKLYRAKARGLFDAAAIHPFSARPGNVLKIVRLARRSMRNAGDRRVPLILTEISWSSGKGKSTLNYGWEETEKGQAQRIREILPMLARNRRALGIQSVYWYTWLSPQTGEKESFSYSGLRRLNKKGKPVSKPALGAWRKTVRKLR